MLYTRRTHVKARRRAALADSLTLLLPVVVLMVLLCSGMLYTRRTHAKARRRAALVGALTLLLPVVVLLVSGALARGRVVFLGAV
jgi:hypothetical protein